MFLFDFLFHIFPDTEDVGRDEAHLHAGGALNVAEFLLDGPNETGEVGARVLVFDPAHIGERREEAIVGTEVVAESDGVGDVRIDDVGGIDEDGGLVSPGARDVAGSVAATADDEEGDAKCLGVCDAGAVRLDIQAEAAETVTA